MVGFLRPTGAMAAERKASRYADRRDPARTPEPRDDAAAGRTVLAGRDGPLFVVQHHAASSEHWDLRLEHDGVLASWAVPKGPSTDPRERRLAVRTEDHPIAYADFEGVIPEGEYGAGRVVVWDGGPYENRSTDDDGNAVEVRDAIERGHVTVRLHGEKISGDYALLHTKQGGDPDHWLLVKADDDGADARRRPTRTEPESVLSGDTVEDVAEEGSP